MPNKVQDDSSLLSSGDIIADRGVFLPFVGPLTEHSISKGRPRRNLETWNGKKTIQRRKWREGQLRNETPEKCFETGKHILLQDTNIEETFQFGNAIGSITGGRLCEAFDARIECEATD